MVTFSGLNLHIFKALDPTEGTYHSGVNVGNHEATTDVMADAEQTCGTRNAETHSTITMTAHARAKAVSSKNSQKPPQPNFKLNSRSSEQNGTNSTLQQKLNPHAQTPHWHRCQEAALDKAVSPIRWATGLAASRPPKPLLPTKHSLQLRVDKKAKCKIKYFNKRRPLPAPEQARVFR